MAKPFIHGGFGATDSGLAHKWIGQLLLAQGRPGEAGRYLERAAVFLPRDTELAYERARSYLLDGKPEESLDALADLELLSPAHPGGRELRDRIFRSKQGY